MTKYAMFLGAALLATPALADPVTEAEVRAVLEVLASDDFEGREPGTDGGRKTLHYLATKWHEAGLVGGAADGGWYQQFKLVSNTPNVTPIALDRDGDSLELAGKSALIIGGSEAIDMRDVPIVFGGYGMAPDGSPLTDIAGKLVVMLADPPPYEGMEAANNNPLGRVMGLVQSGAAGVIAVMPQGTPFEAVVGNLSRGTPRLAGSAVGGGGLPNGTTLGLIDRDYLTSMAEAAGSSIDRWIELAAGSDFAAAPTGMTTDLVGAASAVNESVYFNVVGKLPGTDPSLAAIATGGHWDGYGICRPEGAEDRICNGAVDNASGLAAITALADDLVEDGPYLRDILLIGFTMEEKGLWGARGMAADPPQDIALLLNLDTISTSDNVDRVAVIGRGTFKMDEAIMAAVEPHGYAINETQKYANRQDGAAFQQAGIPAYVVSVNWGDMESFDRYVEQGPYHQPGDEITEVKYGAMVADANLNLALLRHFGNMAELPEGKIEKE